MSDEWRKETEKLHDRITDVGNKVVETNLKVKGLEGQLDVIDTKLDTLIKANGASGGGITKGQLVLVVAVLSGLFGVIQAMIRWWS